MGIFFYGDHRFETKQISGKTGVEFSCFKKIDDGTEAVASLHHCDKYWLDRDIQNELIERLNKAIEEHG